MNLTIFTLSKAIKTYFISTYATVNQNYRENKIDTECLL